MADPIAVALDEIRERAKAAAVAAMRDCPDCRYTEYYVCSHCECPDDVRPCPTVRAVARVLTGDTDG